MSVQSKIECDPALLAKAKRLQTIIKARKLTSLQCEAVFAEIARETGYHVNQVRAIFKSVEKL